MPKVILIDDDYSTEILVENLSFRGFDARRLNSMVAAINCIDEIVAAELVILDIIMERPADAPPQNVQNISGNRTTGMELLRTFRKRNPVLPILVFSATTDVELIDAIKDIPHTTFLSKWDTSVRDFVEAVQKSAGAHIKTKQPRAFIVHGHDVTEKLNLKNYLQNTLKFPEPIILHEKPSIGRTIIEKLEDYAQQVDFVFVLLTPDDKMANSNETNDVKRRARQNVIFELGYFLGVFGRLSGRVFLLHKGPLDLPSDLSGIVYIDISNGIQAAGETIRTEIENVA